MMLRVHVWLDSAEYDWYRKHYINVSHKLRVLMQQHKEQVEEAYKKQSSIVTAFEKLASSQPSDGDLDRQYVDYLKKVGRLPKTS